jgi:hypothetical protein
MLKKIKYKIISVLHIASVKFIFFLQNILNVTHNYQPNPFSFRRLNDKKNRNSFDRYEAIFENLPSTPKNLVDLGCSRGFFVLQAAKNGMFAMGIDHDRFEILYARSVAEINGANDALFMHDEINEQLINKLPQFEMTICTSIFHHWVRIYGKDSAFNMMQGIADKTSKYLVFETGQNNEVETRFYKYLDFMGGSYEVWVEKFLLDIGFKKVKKIGMYSTRLSDVERTLFLAIK